MEQCFTTDPTQRPSARKIREKVYQLMKRKKAHIDLNYEREI
jgi:hypothetical protein